MRWIKYQGCGNDFFLAEKTDQNQVVSQELCQALCDRHFGFGGDGVILVSQSPLAMKIWNADGTVATLCGNGLRCCLNFAYDQGWISCNTLVEIETEDGLKSARILSTVPFVARVNMKKPDFNAERITDQLQLGSTLPFPFSLANHQACSFWMGVPHSVIFTKQNELWTTKMAREIEQDSFFKSKTNVNFVQIEDEHTCLVKTWERGIGWTLACGTGACAASVAGVLFHHLTWPVTVVCQGGILQVQQDENQDLWLQGSCQKVGNCQLEGKMSE